MLSRLITSVRDRWHPLWRLRRSALFRRFQQRCDITVDRRIPDTGIRVALKLMRDASWIINPDAMESEIRAVFALVIQNFRPAVFWDVGANIGFYSWFVRQQPGIERVVMFEPDPVNFALIQRTIRTNSIANCDPRNVALSDRSGEAAFLVDRVSGATGSLESNATLDNEYSLHRAYGMADVIRCQTASVDDLIAAGTPAPNMMKIDVEGAETQVLAGAGRCLAQARPILIVETFDERFCQTLVTHGYEVFRLDSMNILGLPPGIDREPIARYLSTRATGS